MRLLRRLRTTWRLIRHQHIYPTVVFMSDDASSDTHIAAAKFSQPNSYVQNRFWSSLELHVIDFGGDADQMPLQLLAETAEDSRFYSNVDSVELSNIFFYIACEKDVAGAFGVSDLVNKTLSLEYFGSTY